MLIGRKAHVATVARHAPRGTDGFSLIELMVALVVGLTVVLATLGFVVSVAQANSENIQVTRLTQELRAISEVMTRELRRARYTADPVGLIASGGVINQDDISIIAAGENVESGSCIVFGYDEPPDPPSPAASITRSIWLDGSDIRLNPTGTGCLDGATLNSRQVEVTELLFARNAINPSRYDIVVSGRLATAPAGSALDGLERTFRQTIYVRSGEVD